MGKRGFYHTIRLDRRALLGALLLMAAGFAALFTVSAAGGREETELPVIMYHSVLKDESRHGKYVISPAELESDLRWLKQRGYTAVLVRDLIAFTEGGRLPEKPVLLTFDDGYYNNYLYAFELAKQLECKFVISPIGRYTDLYTDTPDENAYYSHVTWGQLREMAASGLAEVQNHSYDMHSLQGRAGLRRKPGESLQQYERAITEDLEKAQEKIAARVGEAPTALAYPFGAFDSDTEALVKKLGFRCTLSCEEKKNRITRDPESLYGLGRFLRVSGPSSEAFFRNTVGLEG